MVLPLIGMILTIGAGAGNVEPRTDPWAVDPADSFNEPHSPLLDGYTIWLMRQNLGTRAIQTTLRPSNRASLVSYFPAYEGERVELLVGTRYSLTNVLTSDLPAVDRHQHSLWVWTGLGIRPSRDWKLLLSTEFYERGTADSFPGKIGNQFYPLFYAAYAFSPEWQLILAGGVNFVWRDNDTKTAPIGGLQLRWIPSKDLRLMVGMPDIFAVEWRVASWLEFAGRFWFSSDADAVLRFKASENISISLRFERQGNRDAAAYFERHTGPEGSGVAAFNSVAQARNRALVESSFRVTNSAALFCRFGRTFAEDVELRLDDEKLTRIPGKAQGKSEPRVDQRGPGGAGCPMCEGRGRWREPSMPSTLPTPTNIMKGCPRC